MLIALITHVIIALSSIIYATYLLIKPSKAKFRATYGLIGATIASGTYLVWLSHSPMLSSCVTGLAYLGVALSLMVAARRRMATSKAKIPTR